MNKKRILVVDDEASFTRLLKLNLEQTNQYEVRVENWPEDALPAAREFQPDLIMLDVMMPRLFGGDVASRLRADPALKDTPIVFLSAAVRKERVTEHDGVIHGFPFLAKPASLEDVVAFIEKHLAK
ncbi:MAG: response regulator [Chloroflexi bacterium]|nr:response regulator [Chloroflexota bacterium]